MHRHYLGELPLWHKFYPTTSGVVLDVGAGNGETAQYYLNHGASHVICIEPEAELLEQNFGRDRRVTVIPGKVDLIKIDCEGAERDMVVESHFPSAWKTTKRFGGNIKLTQLEPSHPDLFQLYKNTRVRLGLRTRLR